jgi:hypothetical protein
MVTYREDWQYDIGVAVTEETPSTKTFDYLTGRLSHHDRTTICNMYQANRVLISSRSQYHRCAVTEHAFPPLLCY